MVGFVYSAPLARFCQPASTQMGRGGKQIKQNRQTGPPILARVSPIWFGRPPTFGSRLAVLVLRLLGWTPLLAPTPSPKIVVAAAPHTNNADFWIGLLWIWATRIPVRFVAKKEIFAFPLGLFVRAVGGIPLDRGRIGGNFVDAVVEIIKRHPEIALAVAPEGSRSYKPYWKTGFYYMALEAGVPIGVGILDWKRKRVGITGYVNPTGDIEADFAQIRALLEGAQGHTPANQGPAIPRPKDAQS